MANALLRTDKLCKTFSHGGVQQHVLKNLDITIVEGDFTIIMGSSGSGKSTLLYALSGMDKPTLGTIHFGDRIISELSNDKLAKFRRNHCGFVFQQVHLLDNMSILDNVLASGMLSDQGKRALVDKATRLLSLVGLNEEAWRKFPSQLSGGEAQRAGIVRALINDPKIVFADEPTGALNSASSDNVLDVLTTVNNNGQSIVMVTHDLKTAMRGNRILYLRDGVIRGDLNLGPFDRVDNAKRLDRLKAFLTDMGW